MTSRQKKRSLSAEDNEANSDTVPLISDAKKKKIQMTVDEYDQFLLEQKAGRFKRSGPWGGMLRRVLHECCDPECARTWSPAPHQCLADDYHCPSCVLHHRNNVDRFSNDRLKWTAQVPNTFYVFSLVDSGAKKNGNDHVALIKFGRTQHVDALKRYRTKELKQYQMKLLLSLRGKLITMTRIENWWKEQAETKQWFVRFSDNTFHGQTECIQVSDDELEQLIAKSKEMATSDDC